MEKEKINSVLLFCGHPDDEVISLGGTIKKMTLAGIEVNVVIFANGNEGYTDMKTKNTIVEIRRKEREKVQKILGIKNYEAYNYTDYGVPANEETYKPCMKMIRKYKPDIIFTHYWNEYISHKSVATVATEAWWQAGWICSVDLGKEWKAKAFYHFEVIELLPKPSHIIDISETFKYKIEAMKAYSSQHSVVSGVMQQIEGLAMQRGSMIGVKYGEALLKSDFVACKVSNIDKLL
jgi:LmbE family N-acetylglucosaminyl deacetylase